MDRRRDDAADARLYAPAVARNREPLLEVLRQVLPPEGLVLELASGTGEHAACFAAALPGVTWQPSEPDRRMHGSILGHAEAARLANLRPPLALDVTAEDWGLEAGSLAAMFCANMLHIAPWSAAEGLIAGAGRSLAADAPLVLYGPFIRAAVETAPSNLAFDANLRRENPEWGLRDLAEVEALAKRRGLSYERLFEMPANNLVVVFRKGQPAA